jgi:transcriptional regulator with XRE-family HTH domain
MHPDRVTETNRVTTGLTLAELAERSGVEPAYVARLVEVGILQAPKGGSGFRPTDPWRVRIIKSLDESGVSLDGIGEAFRRGALSLEFVEQASYHRFSSTSDETFEEIALRTGIPIDLVLTIRESAGSGRPAPADSNGRSSVDDLLALCGSLPEVEAADTDVVTGLLHLRRLPEACDRARRRRRPHVEMLVRHGVGTVLATRHGPSAASGVSPRARRNLASACRAGRWGSTVPRSGPASPAVILDVCLGPISGPSPHRNGRLVPRRRRSPA